MMNSKHLPRVYPTSILCLLLITLAALPLRAQWGSAIAFPGEARDGAVGFELGGKGYIACGILSTDIYEFSPSENSWKKKADAPATNSFSACFTASGKAYLVGGDSSFGTSMNTLWCYDPTADSWAAKTPFPGGARVGMLAWSVNNRIFVGGGMNVFTGTGFETVHNDFYEYKAESDTWVPMEDLPIKAAFASCFVLNGNCYMTLSAQSTAAYSTDLWQYNPTTSSWKKMAAYPGIARCAGIGFSLNGKGYAGMGQSTFTTNYRDLYEYDVTTDSWTQQQQEFPDEYSAWSTSFVLHDKAYLGTGINMELFDFSSSLYAFTPSSPTVVSSDELSSAVMISPNPASESIRFTFSNKEVITTLHCDMYNALGEHVLSSDILSANTPISLSQLPQGLYTLHLCTDKGNRISSKLSIVR